MRSHSCDACVDIARAKNGQTTHTLFPLPQQHKARVAHLEPSRALRREAEVVQHVESGLEELEAEASLLRFGEIEQWLNTEYAVTTKNSRFARTQHHATPVTSFSVRGLRECVSAHVARVLFLFLFTLVHVLLPCVH